MRFRKIILSIISLLILLYLYNHRQISQVYINKIKLNSNKLKNSLKITQITDFHSNKLVNQEKLFKEISDFGPDIIVITGDLIDYKTDDLTLALELIKRAKSITQSIFFVSGNHETNHQLEKALYSELENHDVVILNNKTELININENTVKIMGASFFAEEYNFKEIFSKISANDYNILLSHSPNRPIRYLNNKTDLILSGHTHGGQVRLPIIGAIIAPGQGLFPKYDKGVFNLGNTTLYIDSGLGNSVANIRILNRIQITNIEIEPESK